MGAHRYSVHIYINIYIYIYAGLGLRVQTRKFRALGDGLDAFAKYPTQVFLMINMGTCRPLYKESDE